MPFRITDPSEYVSSLLSCRLCSTVAGTPVSGFTDGSPVLHIGQAPGPHEAKFGKPFAYTAGKRLFQWFSLIGISEDDYRKKVCMSAMLRCFPGKGKNGSRGDRTPSAEELNNCFRYLDAEFARNRPGLIIPIGRFAIAPFKKKFTMNDTIGILHRGTWPVTGEEFDWIALPHPSGLNVWVEKPEGRVLLHRSLKLISEHPVIQELFPGAVSTL